MKNQEKFKIESTEELTQNELSSANGGGWWGAAVGAVVGSIGGPGGAIAGAIAGHYIEEAFKQL